MDLAIQKFSLSLVLDNRHNWTLEINEHEGDEWIPADMEVTRESLIDDYNSILCYSCHKNLLSLILLRF
jgi:hypothetical protein